ncbi:type IV secretion system DNA-binding domain-containing protein [Elongatibacter sediminis]
MKEKLSQDLIDYLYLLLTREQKQGYPVFYHKPRAITNEHVTVLANALVKIFERYGEFKFATINPDGLQIPFFTACGWTHEDVNERQAHIPVGFRERLQTEKEVLKNGLLPRGPLVLSTYAKFWGDLFIQSVGISFNEDIKSSHIQIIGATKAGKTTLLQQLIAEDVRSGASVIVMDSSMDFINKLKYSAIIPPEKLRIIDPRDSVYHPIALNMFDTGHDDLSKLKKDERLSYMTNLIGMLTFLFKSIMGEDLSGHQDGFLKYCCQLMLRVPEATVLTLIDLLENGTEKYQKHINKMSEVAQSFFKIAFPDGTRIKDELGVTRRAIHRRLLWLLDNDVFRNFFTSPQNKFDLSEIMDNGEVLLISTDRPLLDRAGSEFMGRFFISLLDQATMRRLSPSNTQRNPVRVYIDEAGDYFKNESQVLVDLMDKARKCNVGLTVTSHGKDQLDSHVFSAIRRSSHVRIVGTPDPAEIHTLKRELKIDYIPEEPGAFAVNVRGHGAGFIVRSKLGVIESEGKRSEREMTNVIRENRARYSVNAKSSPSPKKKAEIMPKSDKPKVDPHDPLAPLD